MEDAMKTMTRCSLGILAAMALTVAGCGQTGEQQAVAAIEQVGGKVKTDAEGARRGSGPEPHQGQRRRAGGVRSSCRTCGRSI